MKTTEAMALCDAVLQDIADGNMPFSLRMTDDGLHDSIELRWYYTVNANGEAAPASARAISPMLGDGSADIAFASIPVMDGMAHTQAALAALG